LLTDSPNVKNVEKPPRPPPFPVVDPIKPPPPSFVGEVVVDPIKPPPPSFVGEVVVDPIKPPPPEIKIKDTNTDPISRGIIRNPLDPNQIAVVDPILPRIPDAPNAENLKKQSAKEEEKVLERIERLRQRQAELGEQLSKLKSTWIAQWDIPRIPPRMPESLLAIPPWAWALPKPIMPVRAERRRKVPA
jgi:hypothetical protein